MSNANGVISTPLQLDKDLPEVLGVTKPGGGYDLGWYSANSHGQTNPWAKNKPFRLANVFFGVTDADRAGANYGLLTTNYTQSQTKGLTMSGWAYMPPRGTNTEPYRIDDWNGYRSVSQPPATFEWSSGNTFDINVLLNTAGSLPSIPINYKSVKGQTGGQLIDIPVDSMYANTDMVSNISDCLFCVRAVKGSTFYVANTEDTIGGKFGTNPTNNAIVLSNFNIAEAFEDASTDTTFPSDATDKQKLVLYPAINLYKPLSLGAVRVNNGTITNAKGYNGYYPTGYTYPMMSVPLNTILTIRKYKKTPLAADYDRIDVWEGTSSTPFVPSWYYTPSTESGMGGMYAGVGGKTLHFSTQQVIVNMYITLYNTYNSGYFVVSAKGVVGTLFPETTNVLMYDGNTQVSSVQVTPNGKSIRLRITYPAGSRTDYTFQSFSAPYYATTLLDINCTINDGEAFMPKYYVGTTEQLRWR